MDKDRKKQYATFRKREKMRKQRKVFRSGISLFIVIVVALILRVAYAKQKIEEGASVVELKYLDGLSQEEIAKAAPNSTGESTNEKVGYQKELQKFMRTTREVQPGKEAYENSEPAMTIPKAQYVETYGMENGYYKIRYQEKVGFLFHDGLEDIEDPNLFKVVRGLLIVNRKYKLPENYRPGLSTEAQIAFERMREDAATEGISLASYADYQDYNYQDQLVNQMQGRNFANISDGVEERLRSQNQENIEKEMENMEREGKKNIPGPILAGQSEHQTGLAFDIWDGINEPLDVESYDQNIISTWLKENAYKYGFILRYPKDKESITGYAYEPWHYRYIGEDLAGKMYLEGLSLEEYFGLD